MHRLLLGWVALAAAARGEEPLPSARELLREAMERQRAAAAIQREAVRVQSVFFEPAAAKCEPLSEAEVARLVEAAAKAHGLRPQLLRAVMEQESELRPCALSARGAQGLMQLMPATADQFGVRDPFDPKENVDAGARYLKQLLTRYQGNLFYTLGAYNAGPGAVDVAGGVPNYSETREYVEAILRKLEDPATRTDPPRDPTPKPTGN